MMPTCSGKLAASAVGVEDENIRRDGPSSQGVFLKMQ